MRSWVLQRALCRHPVIKIRYCSSRGAHAHLNVTLSSLLPPGDQKPVLQLKRRACAFERYARSLLPPRDQNAVLQLKRRACAFGR